MATTEHPAAPDGYKLKKKKPIYKRVWFWLAVIVVIAVIAAVSGGGGSDSGAKVSDPQPSTGADDSSAPASQGQSGALDAGATTVVDDVTLTSTPLTAVDPAYPGGSAYLCTTVSYKNGGDDPQPFNPFDWKLQDPQGASRDATFGGTDNDLSSGDLAVGGSVSGDVCFEDPNGGAPGTYTVIYKPSFGFNADDTASWINQR